MGKADVAWSYRLLIPGLERFPPWDQDDQQSRVQGRGAAWQPFWALYSHPFS